MTSIPTSILLFLVDYFCQTLTERQHSELIECMSANDAKQRMIEVCTGATLLTKRLDIDRREFEFEIDYAVYLN